MYFVALSVGLRRGTPARCQSCSRGRGLEKFGTPDLYGKWSHPLVSFSVSFYNLSCESECCKHYNGPDGTDVVADRSASWKKGGELRVWMKRRLHGKHKVWICGMCILSSGGHSGCCLSWWCRLKTEPHFTQHLTAGLIYSKLMAALTSVQDFAKVSLTRSAQSLDDLQLYAIWSACVSMSVCACARVCVCQCVRFKVSSLVGSSWIMQVAVL